MTPLRQGSIIWARVSDRRGQNEKHRPGVVVTATHEFAGAVEIVMVAIASLPDETGGGPSIKLPWHRNGHPRTGLRKECYAICHWLCAVALDQIDDVGGYVPEPQLNEILVNLPAGDYKAFQ